MYLLTILTNVNIGAESVDPDQSDFGQHCLLERLLNISAYGETEDVYYDWRFNP